MGLRFQKTNKLIIPKSNLKLDLRDFSKVMGCHRTEKRVGRDREGRKVISYDHFYSLKLVGEDKEELLNFEFQDDKRIRRMGEMIAKLSGLDFHDENSWYSTLIPNKELDLDIAHRMLDKKDEFKDIDKTEIPGLNIYDLDDSRYIQWSPNKKTLLIRSLRFLKFIPLFIIHFILLPKYRSDNQFCFSFFIPFVAVIYFLADNAWKYNIFDYQIILRPDSLKVCQERDNAIFHNRTLLYMKI